MLTALYVSDLCFEVTPVKVDHCRNFVTNGFKIQFCDCNVAL